MLSVVRKLIFCCMLENQWIDVGKGGQNRCRVVRPATEDLISIVVPRRHSIGCCCDMPKMEVVEPQMVIPTVN